MASFQFVGRDNPTQPQPQQHMTDQRAPQAANQAAGQVMVQDPTTGICYYATISPANVNPVPVPKETVQQAFIPPMQTVSCVTDVGASASHMQVATAAPLTPVDQHPQKPAFTTPLQQVQVTSNTPHSATSVSASSVSSGGSDKPPKKRKSECDYIQGADGTVYMKVHGPPQKKLTFEEVNEAGDEDAEWEDDDEGVEENEGEVVCSSSDNEGLSVMEKQLLVLPYAMLTPQQKKERKLIQGKQAQKRYISRRKSNEGEEFSNLLALRNREQRRGNKLPSLVKIKTEPTTDDENEKDSKRGRVGKGTSASTSAPYGLAVAKPKAAPKETTKTKAKAKSQPKTKPKPKPKPKPKKVTGRGQRGGRRGGRGRARGRGGKLPTMLQFKSDGVDVVMNVGGGKMEVEDEETSTAQDESRESPNEDVLLSWLANPECAKEMEKEFKLREEEERKAREEKEIKKKTIDWTVFRAKIKGMTKTQIKNYLQGKKSPEKQENTVDADAEVKTEPEEEHEEKPKLILPAKGGSVIVHIGEESLDDDGYASTVKNDDDGWELAEMKGEVHEIHRISRHTPHLAVYRQTWVEIDGDEELVQWRNRTKKACVDLGKDKISKSTDGTVDVTRETDESKETDEEKKNNSDADDEKTIDASEAGSENRNISDLEDEKEENDPEKNQEADKEPEPDNTEEEKIIKSEKSTTKESETMGEEKHESTDEVKEQEEQVDQKSETDTKEEKTDEVQEQEEKREEHGNETKSADADAEVTTTPGQKETVRDETHQTERIEILPNTFLNCGDFVRILKGETVIPAVILKICADCVHVKKIQKESSGWLKNEVVHSISSDDINAKVTAPTTVKLSRTRIAYNFSDL